MATIPLSGDASKALALAVISASQAPLLLLDVDLEVVAASDSFLSSFCLAADDVVGRSLFSLGRGEWDLPILRAALSNLVCDRIEVDPFEIELIGADEAARHLTLRSQHLPFAEVNQARILLTVIDEPDARACANLTQDLIHDREVLLGEIQHRVANSLQIIASLLLQDARMVASEESRVHLNEAYQRVMAVASLQRNLASSSMNEVVIRPYLERICQSIGASLLHDAERIHIVVTGDDSTAPGENSVSIGLIVTELVINALKYAFPDGRRGSISVDYQTEGDGWALSVCDDGVGIDAPKTRGSEPSLGSAIVKALANQLAATITVFDLNPGTGVSVVHRQAVTLLTQASRKTLHQA